MSKQYNKAGKASATGVLELDFSPPSTYYWHVTQITVSNSGSALSSIAQVYVDQKYFCGTAVGNGDSADGSALIVNNGSQLRVIWSNMTPNSTGTCSIQVEENVIGQ